MNMTCWRRNVASTSSSLHLKEILTQGGEMVPPLGGPFPHCSPAPFPIAPADALPLPIILPADHPPAEIRGASARRTVRPITCGSRSERRPNGSLPDCPANRGQAILAVEGGWLRGIPLSPILKIVPFSYSPSTSRGTGGAPALPFATHLRTAGAAPANARIDASQQPAASIAFSVQSRSYN
jgi:hypothetical protein